MGEYLESSYQFQLFKAPLQHRVKKADLKPQCTINAPNAIWHKPDKFSNVFLNDVRVHYNLEEQDSEINGQHFIGQIPKNLLIYGQHLLFETRRVI